MPRYNDKGKLKVYWADTLADPAAPKVTELTSDNRLSKSLRSFAGFTKGGGTEDASDVESTFPTTVTGMETVAESTLTLYDGDDSGDVERDLLALIDEGSEGFVVFCPDGVAATDGRARVWPVACTSKSPDSDGSSKAATYTLGFAVTSPPSLDVSIVAGP